MSELSKKLREAFKRKRYGAGDDYDPDFDLFDVAADEIDKLHADLATFGKDTEATENRIIDAEFAKTEVENKLAAMRQWVADLQSGMYVNCVYCGYYCYLPDGTPGSAADALKAHIAQCPQHPMSALVKLLQECADDLADMIEGHYAATKDHPAMKMRYDRDMDPVIRARAAIRALGKGTS